MKKISDYIIRATFATAIIMSIFSCEDDTVAPDPSTVAPMSVTEIISSDKAFSWLKLALDKAQLTGTISSGTFTIFAPTNAAFKASGLDSVAIVAASPTMLADILKGHIATGSILAKDIPTGVNKAFTSQGVQAFSSNYVYGENNGNPSSYGVSINGSRVVFADIIATNGVVHKVDAVINPALSDLITTLQANPEFSLLTQALTKAGLNTVLNGTGPFTIFAPVNKAFTDAGIDAAFISAATPAALADLLKYHVVQGRIFTTNFAPTFIVSNTQFSGALPSVVAAQATLLELDRNSILGYNFSDNGLTFTDNADRIAGKTKSSKVFLKNVVTKQNVSATNGVIHAIDKILTPANKTIGALLQADTKFSLLVTAAVRANLDDDLETDSPLTLFAPTDDAFIAYWKINPVLKEQVDLNGTMVEASRPKTRAEIVMEAKDSINSKSPAVIEMLLNQHIVDARYFSNTLPKGELTMLSGSKKVVGDATIKSMNDDTAAKITNYDLGATNGLIHIIDRVLIP